MGEEGEKTRVAAGRSLGSGGVVARLRSQTRWWRRQEKWQIQGHLVPRVLLGA